MKEDELKKEIDMLIKKMESLIKENKSKEEIYEVKNKLDQLLDKYLDINNI